MANDDVRVNFKGTLVGASSFFLNHGNRAFKYGDALFETFRVIAEKPIFWEDHYFRLMASMRILRMEIPMSFTMEFLSNEVLKTLAANKLSSHPTRVRISIFREGAGRYTPDSNDIGYLIETEKLETPFFKMSQEPYEVELFKDYFVNADMLSTLKTTNKILNVVASVFAKENGYQNCLLLNQKKQVVEAINGNVFLVFGKQVVTPPLQDGCLNGILRKKILGLLSDWEGYTVKEATVSPFDIQKADELFITNAISGIQPVTKYRKKLFEHQLALQLTGKLNATALQQ